MTTVEAPLDQLRRAMQTTVTAYHADHVIAPTERIAGTSFFPGGDGLWNPTLAFPERPVMIVGHNFDGLAAYRASVERGCEDLSSPTWKQLQAWFDQLPLSLDQCFFTNALMGIKVGSATGAIRAPRPYRSQCRAFLLQQIEIVRPRLIVTLGSHVLAILRPLSSELQTHWRSGNSLAALDRADAAIVRGASFGRARNVNVVALTHPSYWAPNRDDVGFFARALA